MFTQEYLQKAAENTRLNHPELFETELHKPAWLAKKSQPVVGDSMEFWAVDVKKNEYYRLWAELRGIGSLVMIWVEKDQLTADQVTDDVVQAVINNMEAQTPAQSVDPNKGILEIIHEYYGNEPDRDGDKLTDILLLDVRDNYSEPNNLTYIAGFFNPSDQLDTKINPNSNMRDLLYLDTFPSVKYDKVYVTAAHELQHLVHYNYDIDEHNTINEGASQLSQIITGFEWDNPAPFFEDPSRSLLAWASASDPVVHVDYAKAQMLMLYLFEQFGKDFLTTLVQDERNDVTALDAVLPAYAGGLTFADVIHNWFIANYINDTAVDAQYGYNYPQAKSYHAEEKMIVSEYPMTINSQSIERYAAEYIKLRNGQGIKVDYTSGTVTSLALKVVEGDYSFIPVTSGVTFEDTAFGSAYQDIVFMTMNEANYTGYYSYEFDSQQPYFIMEVKYDDGTPDIITGQQRGILFGTNSPGNQWALKFSPLNEESYLLGASAYVLVDTVLWGPGNFFFHVYDNTGSGGAPGQDIITPIPIKLHHASNYYWWDIDLFDYKEQLSVYHEDFFIAIEHPPNDTNTVLIAVDNSTPDENFTWLFRGSASSNPGWSRLADNQLVLSDGTKIDMGPFDIMLRAEMSYLETAYPEFTVGFLQHPVFTENFEMYVIGGKRLERDRLAGTVTLNGQTTDLSFISTGNTGRVYVDNNVTITQNGTVSLNVSGSYKYGNIVADTLINFNVQSVDANTAGKISNPGGMNTLFIPASTIMNRTTFTAFDGFPVDISGENLAKGNDDDLMPVGQPTTFGPVSMSAEKFELLFVYSPEALQGRDPGMLRVCRFENNKWIPLPGIVDKDNRLVQGVSQKLGTFQVRWSENFDSVIPLEYKLEQNYPNPFNAGTIIRYSLRDAGYVSIKIFDVAGREVKTIVSEDMPAGSYQAGWDGSNNAGIRVASGVYIYRIRTNAYTSSKKMILLK